MENQLANICVMGGMEDTKYKMLVLIKTTKDMLDFSNQEGYPVTGKNNVSWTKTAKK